ncbi:hypothetical protein [uncultured Nonlabens sp.]|jgi:hypothetical protein|uniref:hypothetical protein n=1 Tax=uncultured Nonlabens sp. TaxID=859306 RepID=UPI0030D89A6B|tara:strand:- start:171 stop:1472 length:1302 start_codon:yes stop_codon:yes gene_type:complete
MNKVNRLVKQTNIIVQITFFFVFCSAYSQYPVGKLNENDYNRMYKQEALDRRYKKPPRNGAVGLGGKVKSNKRNKSKRSGDKVERQYFENYEYISEIEKINSLTGNDYNQEEPLLILFQSDYNTAIVIRDEILRSQQWYNNNYASFTRDVEDKLGNILIISDQKTNIPSNNIGIYIDQSGYFKSRFNVDDTVSSYIWISKKTIFSFDACFVCDHMSHNRAKSYILNKELDDIPIIEVNSNWTTKNSELEEFEKSFTKYVAVNDSTFYKLSVPILQKKTINFGPKESFYSYLSDISDVELKAKDTVIVHFKSFNQSIRGEEAFYKKVKKLERKIKRQENINFILVGEIDSTIFPKVASYDYLDRLRKNLFEFQFIEGSIAVFYPDGKVLIKYNESNPLVALDLINNNLDLKAESDQLILEIKLTDPAFKKFIAD